MNEPANESRTAIPMTVREWQLLGLSLIPAALMAFGDMIQNETWLAVYTPLFHLIILLMAMFAAGKRRPNAATAFLLVCDAALIGLGFFHRNLFLCCANCFAIPSLTALAMLSACGIGSLSPLSPAGVWEAFVRSLCGLFEHIPLPFARLTKRDADSVHRLAIAAFSLCICVPILLVVLILLSSADNVFSEKFEAVLEAVSRVLGSPSAVRIPLMLLAALMIFSWMIVLRRPAREVTAIEPIDIPAVFPSMLLPMLNLIYALFVYIQFSNLFVGAHVGSYAQGETAHFLFRGQSAMTISYAEYARAGFFQLVAVSVINLGVLALSQRSGRSVWIRIMSALLIAFTGVILVSAFWRMRLYIAAYGLSVLRVLTLWGMLLIAVLLVISAVAMIAKNFPAFKIGVICALVLWVGLNAVDVDRIIAEYNVYHYLSGELEQIDLDYLRALSPSAQRVVDNSGLND